MSRENIELITRTFAAWNAGDIEAVREIWDPDAIVRAPRGWPEPGPIQGRDAGFRQVERLRETWDADGVRLTDVRDLDNRVTTRFTWHGTGHGPDLAMEMTALYTIRDGLIAECEYFWDHAEALEA